MHSETQTEPLLRVEHLRQYFNRNRFRAVDDISFSLHAGEQFGLVGESGCGKTTTGRSIIRLNAISGGKIFFNGKLISEGLLDHTEHLAKITQDYKNHLLTPQDFRQQKKQIHEDMRCVRQLSQSCRFETDIQMIFQDPATSLNSRMTVKEIIAEGLRIQGMKDEHEIAARVSQAMYRVGLNPDYAGRYPHEFSGGMKQRIGIARAIIMQPKLIIADEPVSALDVSIKAQIINLLETLRKEMNLTVLFISHDLSLVKYFSRRIAVMYAGKIVELASSGELFERPLHPYTKSLLSAIPLPDPEYEQQRTRIIYSPPKEPPAQAEFMEVVSGHWVYCTEDEAARYRQEAAYRQ